MKYAGAGLSWADVSDVVGNGGLTLLRVAILIAIATLIWVPIGVAVGLRPGLAEKVQPVAQFLAAFPANLLYPVAVYLIVRFDLAPSHLVEPADDPWNPMVHPVQRDRRSERLSNRPEGGGRELPDTWLAMVARGDAAWNFPVLRDRRHHRVGRCVECEHRFGSGQLGLDQDRWVRPRRLHRANDEAGDYPRIALGIAVMSVLVVSVNRLLWRPLYAFAERRTRLD